MGARRRCCCRPSDERSTTPRTTSSANSSTREHAKFGEGGFEDVVARVARIEAALGIDDLAKFTIA